MLAAVLVVTVLIGTSLLIFGPWSPLQRDRTGTAPFIEQTIGPGMIRIQAHGLEMIMQVTPGPYFLGEMLAVHFSLTNHTPTIFELNGPMCYSPLEVALAGSGHVILTAQAGYQMYSVRNGVRHLDPSATLFVQHVFSWKLLVQTQVPPDRLIPAHQKGLQVVIDAPPAARSQLFYEYVSDCTRNGVSLHPGTLRWESLSTTTIHPPDCASPNLNFNGGTGTSPPKLLWWKYIVGSPGYATVSGKYP